MFRGQSKTTALRFAGKRITTNVKILTLGLKLNMEPGRPNQKITIEPASFELKIKVDQTTVAKTNNIVEPTIVDLKMSIGPSDESWNSSK